MGLSNALLRTAAMGNNFMIVASSAIVTGLASWFLAKSGHRASHIVYQEVIVCLPQSSLLGPWVVKTDTAAYR